MKKLILPSMTLLVALGSSQFASAAVNRVPIPETASSIGLLALGLLGLGFLSRKLK